MRWFPQNAADRFACGHCSASVARVPWFQSPRRHCGSESLVTAGVVWDVVTQAKMLSESSAQAVSRARPSRRRCPSSPVELPGRNFPAVVLAANTIGRTLVNNPFTDVLFVTRHCKPCGALWRRDLCNQWTIQGIFSESTLSKNFGGLVRTDEQRRRGALFSSKSLPSLS